MNRNQYLCPFCDRNLLRHVDRQKIYWFCPDCKQPMPAPEKHKLQSKIF